MSIPRTNIYQSSFDYSKLESITKGNIVLTNSATSGIYLILKALDIQKDENVIIQDYGHPACRNVCSVLGINVKDSQSDKLVLDVGDAISKIDSKTRVICYIQNNGFVSSDIFKLREVCDRKGIFLLEDSAPSLGQSVNGLNCGSIGDGSVFSFSNSKIVNLGGGGLCSVKDPELYAKIYGLSKIRDYNNFENGAMSLYMPECMHEILQKELETLDSRIQTRINKFKMYSEITPYQTDSEKCYNACTLFLEPAQMKKVTKALDMFKFEYRNSVYPGNLETKLRHIDIPFYTEIPETQVKLITKVLKNAIV